jgi:hypothetical protein
MHETVGASLGFDSQEVWLCQVLHRVSCSGLALGYWHDCGYGTWAMDGDDL